MSKKRNRPPKAPGSTKRAAPPASVEAPRPPAAAAPDASTTSGDRPRAPRIAWIASIAIAVLAVAAYFVWRGVDTAKPPPVTAAATRPAGLPSARFVGGKVCADCHATQTAAWRGSDHDLAMQVADEKSVLGNFADARFAYAGVTSRFFKRDGKYYVNTDGADGKLADFEIKYTFGVHPLQQYLIEFPGGRMQALGIAWDSRPKAQGGQRWFHLYPGRNIKAGDPLHWTGSLQNWNFQCAECHSTQLRKNFDAASGTFRTTWTDLSVSCEACHGPGSNHVDWARNPAALPAAAATRGLVLALDERKGVSWQPVAETGNAKRSVPRATAREIDTCARCHARASRFSDEYVHGASPLDSHRLSLLEEPLYWNDGQMRDEVYNWASFAQSAMYAKGVTCADCHDPHSLKLRLPGNAVCGQCHLPSKYDVAAHTHHKEGTSGAACASCHMPTTTYMVVDPRHDHSLRIPRPDLSVKYGVPNACNNCHAKKSPQWAADEIRSWTGKEPGGFQRFAHVFAAGTAGAPGSPGALLGLIEDKDQPAVVRASAIARIAPWLTPTLATSISRTLNDPDAVVRLAAVEALGRGDASLRQRYLVRMLADPVRAVRIEAARTLAGAGPNAVPAAERASFDKALAEYVEAQNYNGDRPEGQLNLANLYAAQGDSERAIAGYKKSIAIDPTFVAAYVNLADLYRAQGLDNEAVRVLRDGLSRDPNAGALHHALGLALVRQKQPGALDELAAAARLDPDNPRYAYVQAVAVADAGRIDDAIKLLEAAQRRHPHDREVLYGLASYLARSGRGAEAIKYAFRLRELEPENQDYARFAASLARSGTSVPPDSAQRKP